MRNVVICFSVLFFLSCLSVPALAETAIVNQYETEPVVPSGGAMMMDLLIVRPVAMAAVVLGAAVSVVATPFAAASGTTYEVYGRLVNEPFDFAFCRPLGAGF